VKDGIVVVLAEPDRVESRRFRALAFAQRFIKARLSLERAQSDFHEILTPMMQFRFAAST
jgi:hypothetical protein